MSAIYTAFKENEAALKRLLLGFTQDPDVANDLLQEVFIRAFAAERRSAIENPRAYLFQVAKRLAYERFRQSRTSGGSIDDLGGADSLLDETQAMADDWLESRRKLALLTRAVANLPEKCREAFLLRHIDGLQYKQIANRMGISVSAVEKHIATGLLRCAAFLKSAGYEQGSQRKTSDFSGQGLSFKNTPGQSKADADE